MGGQACNAQSTPQENALELVVTAQRREERPEEVPISLTVHSGDQLDRMQSTDTPSLGKVVPSLVMTRSGAFTQPFLRGVGKRSTLGVENSVATYVDGVYLASSISALLDLRGVERVEVLKGPQGTLFGRNATGGVIQIVTKDPEPGRSGEMLLHGGSYEYWRADAYLTGGTDRFAGNVALSYSGNGGYGTNLFTGKTDEGKVDHSLAARSKWVWTPTDALKLTLASDYQDFDQDFSHRPLEGYPPIGAPRVMGFRDGDQDGLNRFHFRYGGLSLRADADLAGMTLVSISAQRWMHARYSLDLDLGPQTLVWAAPIAIQRQFSQEFQLQSNEAAPIRWLAGLYYIRVHDEYDPTIFQYGGSYSARLAGRIQQSLESAGSVTSYAGYGQATWPLGGRTELTTGLRYTTERRSVEARGQQLYNISPLVRPIPGLPLVTEAPLNNSKSFDELTWRASLDRRFSGGLMGYASYSRGFQSGGWNLQTPQSPAFGPERLDDYEIGLKFHDQARRISADASAFLYKYADLQVSTFTPLGSVTTNATSANVRGLDFSVRTQVGGATHVTLGAQVLRARFNSFRNATCTNYDTSAAVLYAPVACDVTGNRLPFAPKFKSNLAADHEVSLGARGVLILSGNVAYNSGYFAEPDNVVRQKAFATVDASVEWRLASGGPSLRLWALNLTNARYYDVLSTFPTVSVLYRPAVPRRLGASVTFYF